MFSLSNSLRFQDAFDPFHEDNSGYIEAGEVRSILDDIYERKAPSFEVDAFVQFFDTDNDGKISWSEFEQGLGSAMAQQSQSKKLLNLLPVSNAKDDDDDYDDERVEVEPEVSGKCGCIVLKTNTCVCTR